MNFKKYCENIKKWCIHPIQLVLKVVCFIILFFMLYFSLKISIIEEIILSFLTATKGNWIATIPSAILRFLQEVIATKGNWIATIPSILISLILCIIIYNGTFIGKIISQFIDKLIIYLYKIYFNQKILKYASTNLESHPFEVIYLSYEVLSSHPSLPNEPCWKYTFNQYQLQLDKNTSCFLFTSKDIQNLTSLDLKANLKKGLGSTKKLSNTIFFYLIHNNKV